MRLLSLSLLALVACASPDSDGDGLTDKEEADFGTDPNVVDTDADGLSDGAEIAYGTNPFEPDSDGDTYLDAWEIDEGTDPMDAASRIYIGYWPYNPTKDDLPDPGFTSEANVGDTIGRVVGVDQHGQVVDLWDFANQGKPVIIDISAQWCPPCRAMSSWISGGSDSYNLEPSYGDVRAAVDAGDVLWVTLIVEDSNYQPADGGTAAEWDDAYPHPKIPVIAHPSSDLMRQLRQNGLPNMHCVNDQMVLEYRNDNQSQYLDYDALDKALELAGQ